MSREVPAFQSYPADKNAETLTQSLNEVRRQLWRLFLGYDPKQNDGSIVERTIVEIDRIET